jgi:hypothetical protein
MLLVVLTYHRRPWISLLPDAPITTIELRIEHHIGGEGGGGGGCGKLASTRACMMRTCSPKHTLVGLVAASHWDLPWLPSPPPTRSNSTTTWICGTTCHTANTSPPSPSSPPTRHHPPSPPHLTTAFPEQEQVPGARTCPSTSTCRV